MVVRGHQDLDANIVRWGLHHLLDGGGCVHRPQSPTTDYAPPPPQPQRARALLDGYDMPAAAPAPAAAEVRVDAVVNDEVIAHALQEELAQVAMAEASGADGGEAERRATVLAQQWFCPEVVSHLPSAPPYVEEAEGISSSSRPEEGSNTRDGQGCSIELVDDFSAFDDEVGKRLNDMVHVPDHGSLLMIAHTTICLVKEGQVMKSSGKLGRGMLTRRTAYGLPARTRMRRKRTIQKWRGKSRK